MCVCVCPPVQNAVVTAKGKNLLEMILQGSSNPSTFACKTHKTIDLPKVGRDINLQFTEL